VACSGQLILCDGLVLGNLLLFACQVVDALILRQALLVTLICRHRTSCISSSDWKVSRSGVLFLEIKLIFRRLSVKGV
jgi:hypothetical protein